MTINKPNKAAQQATELGMAAFLKAPSKLSTGAKNRRFKGVHSETHMSRCTAQSSGIMRG